MPQGGRSRIPAVMTRAVREHLAAKGVGGRDGFRWRGGEITRLEGFTDALGQLLDHTGALPLRYQGLA